MSAATRLAGFAAVLVLVFAGAAVAGGCSRRRPLGRRATPRRAARRRGHADARPIPCAASRSARPGCAQARTPPGAAARRTLRFRIADARRRTVRDFDVEHDEAHAPDRRAPRPDGLPAPAPDAGRRTAPGRVPLRLARRRDLPRLRRLLASTAAPQTLADRPRRRRRLRARGRCRPVADRRGRRPTRSRLDEGAARAGAESELRFTVTRDGGPVAIRALPRRQAATSSRCARATSPSCTCIPTSAATRASMADVPAARAATACSCSSRHDGRVHTAAFTQEVGAMSDRVELPIAGMTCASCAARVERRLNRLDGVTATVNYATEKATVEFDPARRRARAARRGRRGGRLQRRAAGSGAAPDASAADDARTTDRVAARRLDRLRACCRCRVLLLSMIPALQFDNWQWLALTLATPVVLWGALAVPPRRVGEPAPRRGDDGHADLARHARRVGVVAVRAVPRRRRRCRA